MSLPVYQAPHYQRGHGIGALLGMIRGAVPFLKNALKPLAKNIGRRILESGVQVADDVMTGKKIKTSLKRRARQGLKKGVRAGAKHLQKGSGVRRRRKAPPQKRAPKKAQRKTIKRKRSPPFGISRRSVKRRTAYSDIFS